MSDISPQVRALVLERAGYRCERCGRRLDITRWYSIQHRRPRGMGGTRQAWVSEPANLIALCGSATSPDGCHHWAETHRTEATTFGYLLPYGADPTEFPFMDTNGHWWLLDDTSKRLICLPHDITQLITTIGGTH